jgi:dephospho-CoA kinase
VALIVGLTGGIGSGKSKVAELFSRHGIDIVDADLISRDVVLPGSEALEKIKQRFGNTIINADGGLDRPALRQIIFADSSQRRWLEDLLHPLIRERIITLLEKSGSPYTVLMSPLLFETGQHQLTDRVVVVDVPEEIQLKRAMHRDNNSEQQIRAIIDSQSDRSKRIEQADDVIDNSGSLEQLELAVAKLHHSYLCLSDTKPGNAE